MNLQDCPTPLIGFCGFSGTGKTTLLTKLIPILNNQNIRLSVIKHAHHKFDVDHADKDSYKLRHAGATQMLISSSRRWALMTELNENQSELALPNLIEQIDHKNTDLILVEGFKKVSFPKIELHRPSLGHPIMCLEDSHIVAFASDQACKVPEQVVCLDINEPKGIATFICSHFKLS